MSSQGQSKILDTMPSLYATIAPHFTQDVLSPGLQVGYYDEGGVWQFLAPSLAMRLPLRAIEWRNLVGVTKTIDRLPLNFIPNAVEAGSMPLLCLYVIKCEDLDRYKSTVKQQIAQWIDKMNAAKVDWMLLYVPLGTRAKTGGRHANNAVYKRIFEKIRADFSHKKSSSSGTASTGVSSAGSLGGNTSAGTISNLSSVISGSSSNNGVSADRICKIETLEGASVVGAQSHHETQWTELLLRLRRWIMEAFEFKCFQYEEEVRVLDAKRSFRGWDFAPFFVAKERLALIYQQMYLLDDAIRHLDELEAIFLSLIQSENRFEENSQTFVYDAQHPIFTTSPLALDMAEMHHQIARHQAPALLMRLYLFSRQIRTLYLMGDFKQLTERAMVFIPSFHDLLLSSLGGIAKNVTMALHQWAVGACLEIAYACELSWSGHDYQISSASVPEGAAFALTPEIMSRYLGELFYLARRILKKAAKAVKAEGSSKEGTRDVTPEEDSSLPWYEALGVIFQSESSEPFERCVWEVSHLASLHFSRAGRHRFAVFLGGECARYHFRHREFESASRLFRSQARQCEEDKWWELVSDCVKRICDAELALGRSAQAVAACFSMLEIAQVAKAHVSREYLDHLLTTLVQSLDPQDAASSAKMGELIKPTVAIETMESPESDLDDGDVRVSVTLANRFPAGIHIEKLRIRFHRSSDGSEHESVETDGEQGDQNEMEAENSENAAMELEETNVYLHERANVNLVFLYGDIEPGVYTCSGLECAVAGNSFALLGPADLKSIEFEIPRRESTLRLSIEGPPLLSPASMEEVSVVLETRDDAVERGVLEITLLDESAGKSIHHAQFQSTQTSEDDWLNTHLEERRSSTNSGKRWSVPVPSIAPRSQMTCVVWIVVGDVEESSQVAISACLRYDEVTSAKPHTELCRIEREFPILRPLEDSLRLKRVDSRVFVGLALMCNAACGLTVRDYDLQTQNRTTSLSEAPEEDPRQHDMRVILQVEQDLNKHVRDTRLGSGESVHMAFALRMEADAKEPGRILPDKAVLRVGIEYDCDNGKWRTDCLVDIPLHEVHGTAYRIEVKPKASNQGEEHRTGDVLAFRVMVHEQPANDNASGRDATPLLLCLDPMSEAEWILLGKQEELFVFADGSFATTKRLMPTRSGRLRFPQFLLRAPRASPPLAIPSERVYCARRAMDLLVV